MAQTQLDELVARLERKLSPEETTELEELKELALKSLEGVPWIPNPGPQTEAYFSDADVLLYGGEPGGGKTSLLNGLAFTAHRRSLIMRRQYTDLGNIIEEALRLNGGKDGFNGSPPPRLRRPDGRVIDFFAASKVGDEQHRQGNPFDLLAVDEATQMAESQIRFLMGWLRSAEDKTQRKRVVLATNPPLTADGYWVVEWFAPWLQDTFPDPAKPGELRWAINGDDDKLIWVDGPKPVSYKGRIVEPQSYTYIPASLQDNPFLVGSGYDKQLDNLPTEMREVLMGGFKTTLRDQENQVIPTEWIRQAQRRWTLKPKPGVPMCAIGVDCSGGGKDPMVLAPRYDGWYAPLIAIPGADIPVDRAGKYSAGVVISHRRDGAVVVVDMGGGYGGSLFEQLVDNSIDVKSHKGSEASVKRTNDKQLKFTNKRTEVIWKFREALDPAQTGGSPIALPNDPELMADLSAPTWEVTPHGLKVESKEDVCARLGRSTNKGDAVVMAWSAGPSYITDGATWEREARARRLGRRPEVKMGRQNRRR